MKKEIKINSLELKALLFWAMVGFTSTNGGTYENKISNIICKYIGETGMKVSQYPPMGIKSEFRLTGETMQKLAETHKNYFPRKKLFRRPFRV